MRRSSSLESGAICLCLLALSTRLYLGCESLGLNIVNRLILGDAIEVLKTLPDNSVDALITDPPAGISFMGKAFDHDRGGMIPWVNWLSEIMSESLRVMKPGAIGLVWSIPRTCGWTQLALELAGFKIIDSIAILSGSGFPKGADISKQIDKLNDCDREVIGRYESPDGKKRLAQPGNGLPSESHRKLAEWHTPITAPNHPDAVKWDGWKSAQLKPSHEDWFIVQKPVEGTIARNILKWGVGGVHIEACRIGTTKRVPGSLGKTPNNVYGEGMGSYSQTGEESGHNPNIGRYPANTILVCSPECEGETHARSCPVSILGEQGGAKQASARPNIQGKIYSTPAKIYSNLGDRIRQCGYTDTGTAAKFFKQLPHDRETLDTFHYFTKASQKDRSCDGAVENIHPTVKNRSLMRYFCKLITPPGGVVLDPFGGSGSTAIGAIEEGFNYLLIEKEEEYHAIALARIAAIQKPNSQLSLDIETTRL